MTVMVVLGPCERTYFSSSELVGGHPDSTENACERAYGEFAMKWHSHGRVGVLMWRGCLRI
jgi:hypothetical protein